MLRRGTKIRAGSNDQAVLYAKVKWHIAPFLMVLYVSAFLDRVNISFAAISMNRDLNISESLFGLGAGIFFVGYLLFAVPSNIVLVRVGARRWIATIIIVWGLISTSMAFVQDARVYVLLRFLLGAAEAGFFPGIILYLTIWLPSSARANLMALFVLSIPLSNVIGAPLSNWILSLGQHGGLRSWQWLFLLEGAPAILLGLMAPFLLSSGPEHADWLTQEEKGSLLLVLEEDRGPAEDRTERLPWTAAFRRRASWAHAFQYFALMIGLYALGFWVPRILASRGVSSSHLGWLTSLPYALGAGGMMLSTWSSDRFGERRWHVFAAFLCAAAGIGIAAPAFHWTASLAGLSLAAVGVFSAMPIFWTYVTQGLDARLSATTIAFVNSVGNIGGFVGPLIIGTILQHTNSYAYGLLFTALSLALGAAVLLLTPAATTAKRWHR